MVIQIDQAESDVIKQFARTPVLHQVDWWHREHQADLIGIQAISRVEGWHAEPDGSVPEQTDDANLLALFGHWLHREPEFL